MIADEPTTALDITIQARIPQLMINLKKKFGTAMIMITHDLGIVAETCDSVSVMYAGEIVAIPHLWAMRIRARDFGFCGSRISGCFPKC